MTTMESDSTKSDKTLKRRSEQVNSHKKEKLKKEEIPETANKKKHSSGKGEQIIKGSLKMADGDKADKKKHSSEKSESLNKESFKKHSSGKGEPMKDSHTSSIEDTKSNKKKYSSGKDKLLKKDNQQIAINEDVKSGMKKHSLGKGDSTKKESQESPNEKVKSEEWDPKHKKVKGNAEGEYNVAKNIKDRTIGFIGAGTIGRLIINHLVAKFSSSETENSVLVWHHEQDVSKKLSGEKVKFTESVHELFEKSDVIICHLLSKKVSNHFFFKEFGFRGKFERKFIVDLTNTDPQYALELYDTIINEGGYYLDGRLIGGIRETREAKVVTFLSGDIKVFEACEKYLAAFSVKVKFLGFEPGKAARVSSLINIVKAVNLEAVSLMHNFAEAEDIVSLEDLKKFATSLHGPLTKTAVEYEFESKEDKLLQLICMKEAIESVIFSKDYNEAETPMYCTRALYKFICNQCEKVCEEPSTSATGMDTQEE